MGHKFLMSLDYTVMLIFKKKKKKCAFNASLLEGRGCQVSVSSNLA